MAELSKLQIRAKVLSVISEIKTLQDYNEENLKRLAAELSDIEDKHCVFDVFFKEYIKMSDEEFVFAGCLLQYISDRNYLEDKCYEFLKSTGYSDEAKHKAVQLLRMAGSEFDYTTVPEYFENPEDMIDSDTKKLLEKAVFNPEAMLDFLDFVSAVPNNDRYLLLESLKQDYSGDALANIVYPILYSDFDDKFKLSAIDILIDAKSSLAIAPFKYLTETSNNNDIVSACTVGLKKLKLAGASQEKADEYFYNIIKDTQPYSFYTTIPDGNGNQALLISRIDKSDEKVLLSAVVINDVSGIVDCFGFYNISKNELSKIANRFYQSDGKYETTGEYIKNRINTAVNTTIKNKNNFPYEYICWAALTRDIVPMNDDILHEFKKDLSGLDVSRDDILNLLTKDYSFRWYIRPVENKSLEGILNQIYNFDELKIEEINTLIKDSENSIFDEETKNIWKNRIMQCIYLLYTNDKKDDARTFYSMLENEEKMHIFKMVILQRSVFNYFYGIRETAKESLLTTNIFRKKQIQKEKYDINKIEAIIDLLAKSWIHE